MTHTAIDSDDIKSDLLKTLAELDDSLSPEDRACALCSASREAYYLLTLTFSMSLSCPLVPRSNYCQLLKMLQKDIFGLGRGMLRRRQPCFCPRFIGERRSRLVSWPISGCAFDSEASMS